MSGDQGRVIDTFSVLVVNVMLKRPRKENQARKSKHPASSNVPLARSYRRLATFLLVIIALVLCWFFRGFSLWPLVLANEATARRDCDSALRWAGIAECLNADRGSLSLLRARLNRRLGDLSSMEVELKIALTFGAEAKRVEQERSLAIAQVGRLHEVEKELKAWMNNPGQDGADLCDAYTNGLASQGRLNETLMLLNAWEAGFPADPKPHLKRGRIAEHALEFAAAEAEYRAALEKNADYPAALYALGRLLLDRKRPEESLPLFRLCSQMAPSTSAAARVGEANCLQSLGRRRGCAANSRRGHEA